jgi:hypothetical protein
MNKVTQTGRETPIKPREMIARFRGIGLTREQAKGEVRRLLKLEWWGNDQYSISVDRNTELHNFGPMFRVVHLSIHRRDRAPVQDWRDIQQIKNTIVGPQYEGIALHPAESRLVDTANEYHLWCPMGQDGSPSYIPVGWRTRKVLGQTEADPVGAVQREPIEVVS